MNPGVPEAVETKMAEAATPPPSTAHGKRDRGTPTLETPHRPKKRVSLRERERTLGPQTTVSTRQPLFPPESPGTWSAEEVKALVEFVLFHGDPAEKWPSHKRQEFWDSAAKFVQRRSRATLRRTGKK